MNGAVTLVMCILLYIYAVIGIHFYANIVWGDYLTTHANFNNFAVAVLTLFRMTTGENWNGVMHDCMVQEPYCSEKDGTCGTYWAILYFVSFQMMGTLIIIPLFVAVILRQFQDENSAENFLINPVRIEEFRKIWQKFDPYLVLPENFEILLTTVRYGRQTIPVGELYNFLAKVPKPLGLGRHRVQEYNELMRKLSIRPTNNGKVKFQPLLLNLAAIALNVPYKPKKRKTLYSLPSKTKKIDKIAQVYKLEGNHMWLLFAIIYIQRMWRARRKRRLMLQQQQATSPVIPKSTTNSTTNSPNTSNLNIQPNSSSNLQSSQQTPNNGQSKLHISTQNLNDSSSALPAPNLNNSTSIPPLPDSPIPSSLNPTSPSTPTNLRNSTTSLSTTPTNLRSSVTNLPTTPTNVRDSSTSLPTTPTMRNSMPLLPPPPSSLRTSSSLRNSTTNLPTPTSMRNSSTDIPTTPTLRTPTTPTAALRSSTNLPTSTNRNLTPPASPTISRLTPGNSPTLQRRDVQPNNNTTSSIFDVDSDDSVNSSDDEM